MKYTLHTRPYRWRAVCNWLLVGACALIGLAACDLSGSSDEEAPAVVQVEVSYTLVGGDLMVTVALGEDESISDDLIVTIAVTPTNGDAMDQMTRMVTLTEDNPSDMLEFLALSSGTYTLLATATGTRITISGSPVIQVVPSATSAI